MFVVNDDLSIYVTRGDMVFLRVTAEKNGEPYTFDVGEVVRIKVFAKKNCEDVVLQKDFPVTAVTQGVDIILDGQDTKIGDVISKPVDYWYEVELNPYDNPQTIIGYDGEGTRVFRLFPEGKDIPPIEPKPEVIKDIDTELDMTSERPVQNQAIARAFENLRGGFQAVYDAVATQYVTPQMFGGIGDGVADDTEAFQRLFDFVASMARAGVCKNVDGGGTLYYGRSCKITIPKGTYNVTGATINCDYIDIEGNNAIVKSTGKAFIIEGGWKTVIRDLIFVDCETAIELNGENQEMGNLNIENCEFIGCSSHGINITYKQSYLGIIENCRFFKCQYAIEQHNCDLMVVRNCWISEYIRAKDYDSTIISHGGELQIDSCLFVPYPNSNNVKEPCWIDGNSHVVITKSHFGAEAGSKPMIRAMSTEYRYTIEDCMHSYTAVGNCMILVSGGFQGITVANCKTFYDNMVAVRISASVTDTSKLTTSGSFIYFENLHGNRKVFSDNNRWGLIPPELIDFYVGDDRYKLFYPEFGFENNYNGTTGKTHITSSYGTTYGSSMFNGLGEFGITLYAKVNETATNKDHACIIKLLPSTIKGTYQTTYSIVVDGYPSNDKFKLTYNKGTYQNTGEQLDLTIEAQDGYRNLVVNNIESLYTPNRQSAIYPV